MNSGNASIYTLRIHREPGQRLWAEIAELPGCFASGVDMDELREALAEAIGLYLSTPDRPVRVKLDEHVSESVEEQRVRAHATQAA
jgi:predicted RNase H-like HicB family nuclease